MRKGFTLLEILVVIGIIAVLVALGAASYSTAQKKSRDAKRKGDIKAIQNALEQYYATCGYVYPTPASGAVVFPITCAATSTTMMGTAVTDPKAPTPYTCSGCSSTAYTVCSYSLESESPTGYCLSNQQ